MDNDGGEMRERRLHPRLIREVSFRFSSDDQEMMDPGLAETGLILDISAGGLRFLASRQLATESRLLMELDLNGWQIGHQVCIGDEEDKVNGPMLIFGRVLWSLEAPLEQQYEVGVCFVGRSGSAEAGGLEE